MDENEIEMGMLVDYHSMIDGPITKELCVIESKPWQLYCGEWIVSISGVRGGVSVDALTKYKGKMTPKVKVCMKPNDDDDRPLTHIGVYVDDELIGSACIGGEPEDNTYSRDYAWIVPMLLKLADILGADIETNDGVK